MLCIFDATVIRIGHALGRAFTGKDNHEAVVEVVNKEYFAADEVPLPMEKTKHIIRKCTEDDFELPDK